VSTVLIVGSYPPIPVAGAPVTLQEVRRAWDMGDEVTVVSPRISAAHLAAPVFGPLAGRRLDNVRRLTGARRLVLVVEPGFPFPPRPLLQLPRVQLPLVQLPLVQLPLVQLPLVQLSTAAALARAMRRFDHSRLVYAVGPGAGLGVAARAWAWLADAADEVVPGDGGPTDPGVTPLGPPEVRWRERPEQLARRIARRVLRR
jgi:hypothetical protein